VIRPHDILESRPPSLQEERSGKHLFVWGDLGQWLVLDAEAATLIDDFVTKRPVAEVLGEFGRRWDTSPETAAGKVLPVIDALVERGILGSPPPDAFPPRDSLRLSNLTYNITNRCNLRCPWCYNRRVESPEVPVADLADWIAAGASALGSDATFIILGGEPFLDEPRLLDAVRAARPHFTREILVSTNGTLLSDGTPEELARVGATVQVSLDSASAERHDALRGSGVFRRAVSTVERLSEAGVCTVLSMVMTRGCEEEFESYFDLAARLGAQEVRFIPLRRLGLGADHADEVPDLPSCFGRLVDIIRRRPELSPMLRRDFFSILMAACRFSCLRDNCGIGRRCLFVDADGSVFPCPNHRDPGCRCGDVRTTPLGTLMEGSAVLGTLRERYDMERMTTCQACSFRYWCAGDCRAEALAVGGTPQSPSPYCEDLKHLMKEMFWLIAEGWQGLGGSHREIEPWS
jgi:radical SAM protein with 4Fe4S-binding SPASM domain